MKIKKLLLVGLACCSLIPLTACNLNKSSDLSQYLIEERQNLFTANDNLYTATLSTGLREDNYALDGVVNEKVDFAILSFYKNNNDPMANDTYSYTVTVGENIYTGQLQKSTSDNSYIADLGEKLDLTQNISTEIKFTGYNFNQEMCNTSNSFNVDNATAIKIANKELKSKIQSVNKSANIESVLKILKDYSSSEVKNYYWYVGAVSTEGDSFGILIDASTGEVIAKKI